MHAESVPVCSTVCELNPSIPTQNAACCSTVPHCPCTAGTIQDPRTSVTDPFGPEIAYPLQLTLFNRGIPRDMLSTMLTRPGRLSSMSQTKSVTVKLPDAGINTGMMKTCVEFAPCEVHPS